MVQSYDAQACVHAKSILLPYYELVRAAHVIAASADYQILSRPTTLAETEQVKDLQRQEASNLRVD